MGTSLMCLFRATGFQRGAKLYWWFDLGIRAMLWIFVDNNDAITLSVPNKKITSNRSMLFSKDLHLARQQSGRWICSATDYRQTWNNIIGQASLPHRKASVNSFTRQCVFLKHRIQLRSARVSIIHLLLSLPLFAECSWRALVISAEENWAMQILTIRGQDCLSILMQKTPTE